MKLEILSETKVKEPTLRFKLEQVDDEVRVVAIDDAGNESPFLDIEPSGIRTRTTYDGAREQYPMDHDFRPLLIRHH